MQLTEHEPRTSDSSKQDSSSGIYNPTPEERDLVKKCESLFQKAKKYRSKFDYNWTEFYKLFRGKQWKEQRPSYRASEVLNLVWQCIQSQVPIVTDAKPKFEFLPHEPNDREFADLMNDICTSDWQKKNWLFTLTEVIYDSHLYGTGLSSLKYDPDKGIAFKSIDPFYIFPSPCAESLKERCSYVVLAEPTDIGYLKKKFKDKAKYIKPDVIDFSSTDRIDLSTTKYTNPTTDMLYVETSGGYNNNNVDEVLVKTIYMEDDEVIEEEVSDGDQTKFIQRLKYPQGRKVVIANNVVLSDGPIEYDDDNKFPYQRLINYINPRQFWGISEIEALESPQRMFNKLVSYCLDVLYLMGNPIWVVDTTSGVDTQNLVNQPGLIIEKEPGSEVRREEGVQLQPYVLSIIDRLKEWFDQISGANDITRGINPGGVTAASAIADLQNAAQTRIRQKIKNLDAYLNDFGQSYASRVLQFYTAPEVYRLTNKDGTEKYFKMHIEKNEDGYKAVVQRYSENGLLQPHFEEYQLRGKLDIRVTTGSSLPFSKSENEQRAYALYDRGIIDSEEVLKILDYPNWEAIMQRMQEKAQAQAQAQAQQQAAPVK